MKNLFNRLIGLMIIIKTLIPPILLLIFLSFIFIFTRQTGHILTDSYQKVSDNFVYMGSYSQLNHLNVYITNRSETIVRFSVV